MFFNLPGDLQDLVLSFSNPFKDYYKKIFYKSLIYIKNLNNNLKPKYYDFITLKEEYNIYYRDGRWVYNLFYLCDCNENGGRCGGHFEIWCNYYTEYIHAISSPNCLLPKNINFRIERHLKSKQHQIWKIKKSRQN